jgi:hypothetical protein
MVIDAFPFSIESLEEKHPGVYQHLLLHVKPERDNNSREGRRKLWWAFGEPNKKLREQLAGLPRYIATVETSKHRFFTFLDQSILPDNKLIAIASDDAFVLGVLSSLLHVVWSLKSGSWLGVGNDSVYVKSKCFDPFPFPALEESPLKQRIRDLGERLDAHRKRQQELHPDLTLTGLYNVLEKLRAGDTLNAKEKALHDQGLVTLLRQIHDELDAAVLEAYGWADLHPLTPEREPELLTRLVALNHARAAEEKTGHIRWLRPDYQAPCSGGLRPPSSDSPQAEPGGHRPPLQQPALPGTEPPAPKTENSKPETLAWPDRLPDQVTLLRQFLATDPTASAENLSARFGRKSPKRTDQIGGILETLRGLGHV